MPVSYTHLQKLAAVCGELGIDISQSPVIPGGHTSTYLFINDQQGDMQLAVSDMDIYRNLTPRVLAGRKQLLLSLIHIWLLSKLMHSRPTRRPWGSLMNRELEHSFFPVTEVLSNRST